MPNFFVCVLSVQIEKCKHRRLLDISSQVNFPHMLRFFCGWMAFLFTTRILVLEFLSGSLIVALRSVQPVTVDSKVKRNLNTDNSELPRPSNCLRLQWSKWNDSHPCHCNAILFFFRNIVGVLCGVASLFTTGMLVGVNFGHPGLVAFGVCNLTYGWLKSRYALHQSQCLGNHIQIDTNDLTFKLTLKQSAPP